MLHDLNQGLEAPALCGILPGHGCAVIEFATEHVTGTDIGIVGNNQRIAGTIRLVALRVQAPPQFHGSGFVDKTGRQRRHLLVAEHHIAVQVATGIRLHAGPLVADKGGEVTVGTAIIVLLGGLLHLLPGRHGSLPAQVPALTTLAHVGGLHSGHIIEQVVRTPGPVTVQQTLPGTIAFHLRRIAHMHFTDQFRMIRHHGEIQRPAQLYGAHAFIVVCPGLDAEPRPLRKAVGLLRRGTGALGTGIQGVTRMHVEIAEERLHQRFVRCAGLPLLSVLNRTGYHGGRCRQQQH